MSAVNLHSPVEEINRVGKAVSSRLQLLRIKTVLDLVYAFPFRYDDFSLHKETHELVPGMEVTVEGRISSVSGRRGFRKVRHITEVVIRDERGEVQAIWFNQPYLDTTFREGQGVRISGKVKMYRSVCCFINPSYEKISTGNDTQVHTGGLTPVYSLTANITQKQMRFLVSQALRYVDEIDDPLPEFVLSEQSFVPLSQALRAVHFPKTQGELESARKRLKFEELLIVQLQAAIAKKNILSLKGKKQKLFLPYVKKFLATLPFELTASQKRSLWQILQDMERDSPMNRLLQGDVGSGKTVVAFLAMLNTFKNKQQSLFMAPTEILAQQHWNNACKIFRETHLSVALLTNSFCETNKSLWTDSVSKQQRREIVYKAVVARKVDCVIGTHALLEDILLVKNLGLVVVDEQHRFGVSQRKKLRDKLPQKGFFPHMLSMTATPIPRTLALTAYGDLDISTLKELPKGRKKVITQVVSEAQRLVIYEFVASEIEKGRQAFIICPLIEESDTLGVASVKKEYEKLRKSVFQKFSLGLLHGKLKPSEKEQVMRGFSENTIRILVATSVVEVGIDVPNASLMLIEGAGRFGLSQLHQFRGRIGRGEHASYCFLFSEYASSKTNERLKILTESSDGFYLAQKDLELRGPGEVYGMQQSGFPEFRIASFQDGELISLASSYSQRVTRENLLEQYPSLNTLVTKKASQVHYE